MKDVFGKAIKEIGIKPIPENVKVKIKLEIALNITRFNEGKDWNNTAEDMFRIFGMETPAMTEEIYSCEWCGAIKTNPNGLCIECGRFPSPSSFRSIK